MGIACAFGYLIVKLSLFSFVPFITSRIQTGIAPRGRTKAAWGLSCCGIEGDLTALSDFAA